ncbi:MAG: hypothetical protein RIS86_42, partial [Planctomycetota bacterium]
MRTNHHAATTLLATFLLHPVLLASSDASPLLEHAEHARTIETAPGAHRTQGADGGSTEREPGGGTTVAPPAAADEAPRPIRKTFPAPFPLDPMVARDIEVLVGAAFQRSAGFEFRYLETLGAFILVADESDFPPATDILRSALDDIGRMPGARGLYGNGRFDLRTEPATLSALAKRLRTEFGVNIVIGDEASNDFPIPALELVGVDASVVARILEGLPPRDGRVLVVRETNTALEAQQRPGIRRSRLAEGFVVFADRAEVERFETMIEADIPPELADRLIDVISVVAELEGVTDLVKARYHEPTRSFFVRVPHH